LEAASEPYLEMLKSWVYKGVVKDPYNEFLIEDRRHVVRDAVSASRFVLLLLPTPWLYPGQPDRNCNDNAVILYPPMGFPTGFTRTSMSFGSRMLRRSC
jgi:hypothetical protein